jgi:very-short-patch-repair endonuclease
MTPSTARANNAWGLARAQHGVVTRSQLFGLGLTADGIKHRIARGRLHVIGRGIYAVAAVLAAGGPGMAALSHSSAAALFKIGVEQAAGIEISRRSPDPVRIPGIRVHRRPSLRDGWFGFYDGIPITSPVQTLIDLATRHDTVRMERAMNEADHLGLVRTDDLRKALDGHPGEPGVAKLRGIIDRATFRYTRSELERAFLPLAERAGLEVPRTSVWVDGFEVDFHFPEIGLVVEADSLTYHRTAAHQKKDHERDQAHAAAGLTTLRFTHGQIRYEPESVVRTLRATATHRLTR